MVSAKQKGLFVLRLGLGVFLLLWAIDKLVASDKTVKIFEMFYKLPIGGSVPYIIGGLELILALAIIIGLWKRFSYGIGLLLHFISTASTWKQLLNPFGQNHLFIAALPVLAGFIALYLLRDEDTWLAVSKKKNKR
ncbi:hypothetical protein COV18_00675 [Candidatus Woesearchaeota archaeon CG10_big_fil_rev_8_21_14_0_10_37_12]|nr:MAG: hypothetical protein COV18_00675 [Candidatus Woesearchaeota archaeon CG10_big_fil_rev_8_21_14_0_10_37_12]